MRMRKGLVAAKTTTTVGHARCASWTSEYGQAPGKSAYPMTAWTTMMIAISRVLMLSR